jgi:hypothetical protein
VHHHDQVLVILNLSSESQSVILTGNTLAGSFQNVFLPLAAPFISGQPIYLAAWDYRVFIK